MTEQCADAGSQSLSHKDRGDTGARQHRGPLRQRVQWFGPGGRPRLPPAWLCQPLTGHS